MIPTHWTFLGSSLADGDENVDVDLLSRLPADLAELLRQTNGFIGFQGGLHVRGACREPKWHSLRDAWQGESAFQSLYSEVRPSDAPFAEDCMGDQFLLRDEIVHKLSAETGDVESLNVSLPAFLQAAEADPVEFLALQPLLRHQQNGGSLEPGQLLSAYPPFIFKESADGVHLAAIPTLERRRFLADLASQIRSDSPLDPS